MQEPGGVELLSKLTDLLREHGDPILQGRMKLTLTASSLQYLNLCFESLQSGHEDSGFQLSREHFITYVPYLHDFLEKTKSLKLVQGHYFNFDLVNISCFISLQYLEVKKVPVGYIQGIQTLRSHLKRLRCSRSVISLDEIFVKCGADRLSTPVTWPVLEEIDLSYNGIEQLDDSIKLFPSLHSLNLSHNAINLSVDDENCQFLSEVNCLNLGFNQIKCIPRVFLTGVEFKIVVLILRNNNLENLVGIQCLSNLEILDVANNFITSFSEMSPLAPLAKLTSLCLEGNPVSFHPDYRVNTVSCLNPLPREKPIVLDGKELTTLEELFIGNTVQPVSPLSYIPAIPIGKPKKLSVTKVPEELLDSSNEASSLGSAEKSLRKLKKKKRRARTRQISLSEAGGDTSPEERSSTPKDDSQLEHEEDLEQLEKLRRLGGEGWLPAVNRIMGVKTSAIPTRLPSEQEEETNKISSSLGELSRESLKESDIYSKGLVKHDSDQEDIDTADGTRCFLVTSKTGYNELEEDHLFVTVDDEYILEANSSGKVICRLETKYLVSVSTEFREASDTPVVLLQFDYIKRDWRHRRYSTENNDTQPFVELLEKIVERNKLNKKAAEVQMQCLKCSAHFVKSEREVTCPDCSSTMVIEVMASSPHEKEVIEEPFAQDSQQLNATVKADTEESVNAGLPFQSVPKNAALVEEADKYLSRESSSATFKDDIGIRSKGVTGNDLQNPQSVFESGITSGFFVPRETREVKTFAASNSKVFTVANNSDRFVVNSRSLRTSALTSSLKLADEMKGLSLSKPEESRTTIEEDQKHLISKSNIEDQSVQDNRERFLYKALTNISDTVYSAPLNPNRLKPLSQSAPLNSSLNKYPRRKDLVKEQLGEAYNDNAPIKTPQASYSPGIFKNLLTRLSGRLSEPSSEESLSSSLSSRGMSSRSPTPIFAKPALAFHISEDNFTSLDHRLKLFFEVYLFTGGSSEVFQCLIKAPVVLYGSTKEMSAVLVISNTMCYICRMKEVGSGTPAECFTRLATHPLEELLYIDCGLGSQSFRLEFDDEDGYYVFLVRDRDRCEKFLECFIGALEKGKAKTPRTAVFVNKKDPQTLSHIRSQVFGVTEEQLAEKGERLHELALLFTDPPLIKDRKSLLVRNHPNCFVGKEFVDWLLRWQEVQTRQQAIELGQSLLNAGFVEHASKEPYFEDKDQFYRFTEKLQHSYANGEEEADFTEIENSLSDFDLTTELFLMASYSSDENRPGEIWNPVSVVVTKTHFALAEQNPQWPLPRRLIPPLSLKEPQFVCIARHKISDLTALDFYEDSPCYLGLAITDEDAPLESAETHWILQSQTPSSLLCLVKLLKESWEKQFSVELPQTLHPMLED